MRLPNIPSSFVNQSNRIDQGVKSGELTRGEAKELRAEQKQIAGMIGEAFADGQLTKAERQEIRGAQRDASKNIYENKHDGQRRTGTPRADARQDRQTDRIAEGLKSGELSFGETRGLLRQQARIGRAEEAFKADGVVSAKEKAILERMQDRASGDIYEAKHNTKQNKYI